MLCEITNIDDPVALYPVMLPPRLRTVVVVVVVAVAAAVVVVVVVVVVKFIAPIVGSELFGCNI
jgi:hypothetical protein